MDRADAITVLREIEASSADNPSWVSLVQVESDSYELHIRSQSMNQALLKNIVSKFGLVMRCVDGVTVIYGENGGLQEP